jgi:predicted metal-dependent hydrolase
MKVRKVEIDFSDAKVHWVESQPEYSQLFNAISTAVPYLEPFLIKTVRECQPKLTSEELRRDVDLFIAQEARHFKLHGRFNRLVRDAGYPIKADEEGIKADYERFWKDKGLKFSLAYSEGFETFGPILCGFFFEGVPDLMSDWDEPTVYLYLWHLAEEYEHRCVCNYMYKELYGGYWYRIYGMWFAMAHLFGYTLRLGKKLIAVDLERGLITGRWRSKARYYRILGRLFAYMLPRVLFICHRPSYDPGTLPPPANVMAFLAEASNRYGVADPA